jgi:hypothetical protein
MAEQVWRLLDNMIINADRDEISITSLTFLIGSVCLVEFL